MCEDCCSPVPSPPMLPLQDLQSRVMMALGDYRITESLKLERSIG